MNSPLESLLELIVKGIVNTPEEVTVVTRMSEDFPGLQILEISVSNMDKGVLIGKQGKTINAIRDIIRIAAIRKDVRVRVTVKEDEDRAPRGDSSTQNNSENEPTINQEVMADAPTEDILNDEI